MIFQNCLKFHSPNGSWNYVQQFRNITRGIYDKYQYKSCYYLYKSHFTCITGFTDHVLFWELSRVTLSATLFAQTKSPRKPQSGSKWKSYRPSATISFAIQFSDSVSKTKAIFLFTILKDYRHVWTPRKNARDAIRWISTTIALKCIIIMRTFRQSTNQNHYPVFG